MAVSPRTSTKSMPRETSTKSKMATGETAPSQEPAGESAIGTGKPDKAVYDAEQNKLRGEIDALQAKFNTVKDKINMSSKDGPHAERRKALRGELDELRNQQANGKNSRGRILDQLKAIQETISKKTKDLQAARSKFAYKSVADLDSHVKRLEATIDSGSLKLAEEKRALQEVNQAKRSRKIIENFQKDQQSIDDDRAKADELRKQMDDPQTKANSERFDAIKQELDGIKKEGDEAYASRNALYTERNTLKEQLDELFTKKKQSAQNYRDANDRFHLKLAEDRARRSEKRRAQKQAEEAEKNQATAERLREEAAYPAYQREIEECQLLVEHFSQMQKGSNVETQAPAVSSRPSLSSVPSLELRQVDAAPEAGMTALKKKGEEERSYFVGGKGKKRGPRTPSTQSTSTSAPLRLPFHIVEALMKMSIPTPSPDEIPRVLEDIKTKKAWFEANQERVTAENKAKAEREIQRLIAKTSTTTLNEVPPNGNGEKPAEPAPTPLDIDNSPKGVSTDAVDAELEKVGEVVA